MIKSGNAPDKNASRWLALLRVLFSGSGCAALIYEIVWYQLLQFVIGSTSVSLGVLLATFMGGLCLGSIALPRFLAARMYHPLRVYAVLEMGIGLCGILVYFGMPLAGDLYISAVGHGMSAILFRALICAACLMPPTLLMGASLPAASRWIETTPWGVSWMGLLYAGNTLGAVFGCLLAGFYLLRVFDMATATFVAAAVNALVALAGFAMAARARNPRGAEAQDARQERAASHADWTIYVAIALSGATALGAEVIWTRLLGLLLGATVYTFSIILAVFLIGLGAGSGAGAWFSRSVRPRAALGYCQLFLVAGISWTAFMLARSLPNWPINPMLSTSPWVVFQLDLARAIWAILPATLLWGASFPLALAGVAAREDDAGRLVGKIYAANTAGAIAGALAFSLVLIPWVGTQQSQRVLIAISMASALVVLLPVIWASRAKLGAVLLAAAMAASCFLVASVAKVPGNLIAYGRRIMSSEGHSEILYTGEGINSSIAISRWDDGAIQFHVSGKVEASTEPYDMRLQRLLGHMPALLDKDPRSVLVVGFGAGVTAGSFVVHPTIQHIVICEIEPLIPPVATRYFAAQNYNVLHDPRTEMVYDDARHFVLTTREKFDIITSDPIHPWVKGSASLYTKEYFEMVKQHLKPGGIVTQWVPLYESDEDAVKSEIATFFDVFPYGTVWANDQMGEGYDLFLLGQAEPIKIDLDQVQQRLDSPEYARVAASLREVGVSTAVDLFASYAGEKSDLGGWLQGAQINRDGNLRLQYLAGMDLNMSHEGMIFADMLGFRRFPDDLITGSADRMQQLRTRMGLP